MNAMLDRQPRPSVSPWNPLAETGPAPGECARSLRDGDVRVRESFVRRHAPEMLATATRIAGAALAPAVLQQGFRDFFRSLEDDRSGDAPDLSRSLHRLVIRAALSKCRRDDHAPSIRRWLPAFHADGHRVVCEDGAAAAPGAPASRAQVRASIERLPDAHRLALLLVDVERLSPAEAGAALAMDAGAVKTYLHEARMALRELLERRPPAASPQPE